MTEGEKKISWPRRWFGGLVWKDYFQALPFCIGVLVVPFLPTLLVLEAANQSGAPLFILLLFLLTFGYPILRVKQPRAAWWVGNVVAVGSLFGVIVLNIAIGWFYPIYVLVVWLLMIPFLILNWQKLQPWTFAVLGAGVVAHFLPMGVASTLGSLFSMGLMALYFRLPDRNVFPRAPIVITLVLSLLLARGVMFYFDVGGDAEVKSHPAARKVFEYTNQRKGWASTIGVNPRFLNPTCDGQKFMIGTKFSWKSGLTVYDPATRERQFVPMSGGTTENIAQDCQTNGVFVGNIGANQVFALDELHPKRVLLREKLDGVKAGLLKLDRKLNRLYVAATNKPFLYVLRAATLVEQFRVEFNKPVSDLVVDRQKNHEVIVATAGGEVTRLQGRPFRKGPSATMRFGKLNYNLALDEVHRRVFVSSMFGQRIGILDPDTMQLLGEAPIARGAYYMQYDYKRDLLYIGNFFKGTVAAFSYGDDKVKRLIKIWEIEVGRRVRYLTLDRLRDQLCFTSAAGGFCLSLETLYPAPATALQLTPDDGAVEEIAAPPAAEASPAP